MRDLQNTTMTLARLENVSKRYGNVTALNGLNLSVNAGEILALLGPNGAGKTTAVSLLLNLIEADSGKVSLFDQDPQALPARQRIGVMLQSAELPETLRVSELIQLTQSYYPYPRDLKELAEMAAITDLLQRPYGKLSGGQQRRVQFAMAICAKVDILFLDEPTVGLDIEAREAMWVSLRKLVAEGCSIVLTTHYLEEAENLCRNLAIIDKGKIIEQGPMKTLLAKLDVEGFLLDIEGVLPANLPQIDKVSIHATDDHTLDIEKPRAMDLNHIFSQLNQAGIQVRSMRNKVNRLEELFVKLTGDATKAA